MYYTIRKVQRLLNVVEKCEKDQEISNFIFQTKDVMFRSCNPLLKYDLLPSSYRKVNLIKKTHSEAERRIFKTILTSNIDKAG